MTSSPTPRLRVLAGPSPSRLTDISALVNTAQPHLVQSDRFSGRVVVHIKGFPGASESEYFERDDRRGITWSIQVQGRFLHPHSADDVLFGNTFDRPLKLPWGSGAALTFMHFIDPTLEHDLRGPRPWALSPLITTMPHFVHAELPSAEAPFPPFPPPAPECIKDDTRMLCRRVGALRRAGHLANGYKNGGGGGGANGSGDEEPCLTKASKRRGYFANAGNRREIIFGPEDVLTTDFCYGFLSFPSLALNLPGGISFDLKKYWDGQPVRFVCVDRHRPPRRGGEDGDQEEAGDGGDASMFWCVVVEAAED